MPTFDLIYFLGKNVFGDDGFQNVFFYQPIFSTLDLKGDFESKGLFKSSLEPIHKAFSPKIKQFGYKIRIQLNNTTLVENSDKSLCMTAG